MPAYRRLDVLVDAIQWTGDNLPDVQKFLLPSSPLRNQNNQNIAVPKPNGALDFIGHGCWILRENGQFTTLKDSEFQAQFKAIVVTIPVDGPPPLAFAVEET